MQTILGPGCLAARPVLPRRSQYPDGFPVLPRVPAGRYRDPDVYALEREHVFGRSWLFVAHGDQLPEQGDVLRLDVGIGPIILVRQDDGTVRAFYNTCQHRGSALVLEPTADDARSLNERTIAATEVVLWEDLTVLPGMQASIDAGSLPGLTLSYQERRIFHLHEQIDRAIGAERLPEALRVPAVLGPYIED